MDRIEDVIDSGCEDQRADLRIFAETGDEEALSRIHFDGCHLCDIAVDRIIELRNGLPPAPMTLASLGGVATRRKARLPQILAAACIAAVALIGLGLGAYGLYRLFSSDETARTELERLDARIVFARLPGRPDVCVASLRGVGGYGPTFLSAAPCSQVKGRIESDEDLAWHLRSVTIIRMRDTDVCLAHAPDDGGSFTLPCSHDD